MPTPLPPPLQPPPPQSLASQQKINPSSHRSGQRGRYGRYKNSRAGIPNYKEEEITALLDILEEVNPFGANLWALLEQKYVDWAAANDGTSRDSESLKAKFDRLVADRRKTGNHGCLDYIRRAKHIRQAINGMCGAVVLGEDNELVDVAEDGAIVGQKQGTRPRGMMGISRKKKSVDEAMLEHVGEIKESFT